MDNFDIESSLLRRFVEKIVKKGEVLPSTVDERKPQFYTTEKYEHASGKKYAN